MSMTKLRRNSAHNLDKRKKKVHIPEIYVRYIDGALYQLHNSFGDNK